MIELGQSVHHAGLVGLVTGLVSFLAGGSRASVQRSFGLAEPEDAPECMELERLSPLGCAVLGPYCEILARATVENPISLIGDATSSRGPSRPRAGSQS
jgi:hypothetical protein